MKGKIVQTSRVQLSILSVLTVIVMFNFYCIRLMRDAMQIGYIRSGIVVEKYFKTENAKTALQERIENWNKNAETLQKELDKMRIEYEKNKNTLNLIDRRKIEQKIIDKEREYLKYTRTIKGMALNSEKELMNPIIDEINSVIEDFAQEKGYRVIFGTLEGGNLVYAENSIDLTYDILRELNGK